MDGAGEGEFDDEGALDTFTDDDDGKATGERDGASDGLGVMHRVDENTPPFCTAAKKDEKMSPTSRMLMTSQSSVMVCLERAMVASSGNSLAGTEGEKEGGWFCAFIAASEAAAAAWRRAKEPGRSHTVGML